MQNLDDGGLTVVMVTHEPDIAQFAKRIIVFRDGRIKKDDPVLASIARRPSSQAARLSAAVGSSRMRSTLTELRKTRMSGPR